MLGFSPSIRRGQTKLVASLVVLFSLLLHSAAKSNQPQSTAATKHGSHYRSPSTIRNMEPATDTENNVRRSKRKAKSGNGAAKEHKEQLQKLQQKVKLMKILNKQSTLLKSTSSPKFIFHNFIHGQTVFDFQLIRGLLSRPDFSSSFMYIILFSNFISMQRYESYLDKCCAHNQ
ncbi:hypothetical protein RIF29_21464 [Crotalaria pallida]|uniref:Uncharacterized protein n=1 Tax=Crotalaria pallida TaxID=3830 RepID=A0AAN9F6P4_CROPI